MENIIILPAPQKDSPFTLMQALETRRTTRKWSIEAVSEQDLSNLLWAACGITKEKRENTKSKRTAPSACNAQEIRVYVLLETGIFRYEEEEHALLQISTQDIREYTGRQKLMKNAPVGLVYVADLSRMNGPMFRNEEAQQLCAWVDTGFISQNVYLYCASANLATAILALIPRDDLSRLMKLGEHEKIVLTQVVGIHTCNRKK